VSTYTISPLLEINLRAESRPTDMVVDLIRHNVPTQVTSEAQAVEVLVALGRDPEEAREHVDYCVHGVRS
jgi:hypothetical protein